MNNSRTRAEKARAQKEHADANKEVKRNIKTDKKNYINSLAKEAEEAAYGGNMKQLYDTTRKLSGKYGRPERPVKVIPQYGVAHLLRVISARALENGGFFFIAGPRQRGKSSFSRKRLR